MLYLWAADKRVLRILLDLFSFGELPYNMPGPTDGVSHLAFAVKTEGDRCTVLSIFREIYISS